MDAFGRILLENLQNFTFFCSVTALTPGAESSNPSKSLQRFLLDFSFSPSAQSILNKIQLPPTPTISSSIQIKHPIKGV